MFPLQGHRRSGSYSNVRAFVRPELSLESSLRRPVAPGYVPAQPVNMVHVKHDKEEGGGGEEGSSTESQSHLRQSGSQPAGAEIQEYVHSVVDSQYVLIEASPSSKTTHQVREGRARYSANLTTEICVPFSVPPYRPRCTSQPPLPHHQSILPKYRYGGEMEEGTTFLYFTMLPTSISLTDISHMVPPPWVGGLQPDVPGCPHERP